MSERRIRIKDRRKAGWFRVDNELISVYGPELGVHGIAVYAALAYHTNSQDSASWPSVPRIAREIGSSEATVRRAIAALEKLQLIEVREAFDAAGQMPSEYFLLEVPAQIAPDWREKPRPIRSAVSYSDAQATPPLPATERQRPPITLTPPPNHTDTPPLSARQAPGITETGPPLTRRREPNQPNRSPNPLRDLVHDTGNRAPDRGRSGRPRIELMRQIRELERAGILHAVPAAIAAELELSSDELHYLHDAAERPHHTDQTPAAFATGELLPALDRAGYDYRRKEATDAPTG